MGTFRRNKNNNNDRNIRIRYNRKAFDTIIGTREEPGAYATYRRRNGLKAMLYGDSSAPTPNGAAPSVIDFCCDVDAVIKLALKGKKLLKKFMDHYIIGTDALDAEQQNFVEQRIGQLLRRRRLYPVPGYFKTIRNKRGQ